MRKNGKRAEIGADRVRKVRDQEGREMYILTIYDQESRLPHSRTSTSI